MLINLKEIPVIWINDKSNKKRFDNMNKLLENSFNKNIRINAKKYDFYSKTDPESTLTDSYTHMISGEGKFSGPKGIELQQLPKKFTLMI